jgi:predicted NUDIX family phosphoesterase
MDKMDEMIYAIEVDKLFSGVDKFNGFIEVDQNILVNIQKNTKIMRRGECENDLTIKHLIPYIFLTTPTNKIFVTRRTSNQTENRLHNKASIGIGGHVGEFSNSMSIYTNVLFGAIRELNEELYGVGIEVLMAQHLNLKLVGFVDRNADEVSQVHFGMVFHLLVDTDMASEIRIKETKNMIGKWMDVDDAFMIDNYELWSKTLLDEIWGK